MKGEVDRSAVAYARLAGGMYLVVDVLYVIDVWITGRLRVPGDIVETAHRITQSQVLYRVGVSCSVLAALCTVLIGVGLYAALQSVDRRLALTGLAFRTAEGVLFGFQAIVAFAFLNLYTRVDTSGFSASQLAALAGVRSAAGSAAYDVAALFFSFGSVAFFYLFVRSGCIPKWLAWLGLVGSVLVPVACFGDLAFQLANTAYNALWVPIAAAEILTAIWLLRGIDMRPPADRTAGIGRLEAIAEGEER